MTVKEVTKEMKESVDGASYISIPELCNHLGKCRNTIKKYIYDLDFIGNEYDKQFFIPDVAERIVKNAIRQR